MEPCLATPLETVPEGPEWLYEIKHDGYRAQLRLSAGKTVIRTRRGYDWTDTFSSIAAATSQLAARDAILDGEVVVLDERGIPDYRRLQEALAQRRPDRLTFPCIRATSPLSVPVKKPKATWVEPVIEAEIEYSALTTDKLLRAPVYKGIREDLAATPSSGTSTRAARAPATRLATRPRVPQANILQLLPDAVVPSRKKLAEYWHRVSAQALEHLSRRPLKLVRHTRDTTFYHMGPLPPLPASVHALRIRKRGGGEGIRLWIEDLAGLLGLVQIGAVELHPWNARVEESRASGPARVRFRSRRRHRVAVRRRNGAPHA